MILYGNGLSLLCWSLTSPALHYLACLRQGIYFTESLSSSGRAAAQGSEICRVIGKMVPEPFLFTKVSCLGQGPAGAFKGHARAL